MTDSNAKETFSRLVTGYWISQAIYVAAKLELADLVNEKPKTAEELAAATGVHAPSLYRLLRALASVGIFAEDGERRFGLTPLAERLRSDLPDSQRAMAIMMGEEHYHVWGDLIHSIQTGEPAFEKIYEMPIFEYLARNPEKGKIFDQAMTGIHGSETASILEAYDFSQFQTAADIGGGNGSLLAAILQRHPHLQGILFDLPPTVQRARGSLDKAGVADRCRLAGGDFFQEVPSGADVYLLRHIIHDWDDGRAAAILRNCRQAMKDDARVLVIESVIPPGNEPSFGKLLDLTMLVLPGGRERTEEEYRRLFADAGLKLTRITPTDGEISLIEGVKQEAAS